MLITVIVYLSTLLRNGHHRIDPVDLQLTVHYREGHRLEVRVRILEVAGQDTHVVCAGCRLGHGPCRCRSGSHRGRHIVQRSIRRHALVTIDSVLVAVVVYFGTLLCNGHSCVDLVNPQLSIYNHEGHIGKVGIGVREVVRTQFHVVATGIRATYRGISTESKVILCVQGGRLISNLNRGHVIT